MNQELYDWLSEKRQDEIYMKNHILEHTKVGEYDRLIERRLNEQYALIDAFSQEMLRAAGIAKGVI